VQVDPLKPKLKALGTQPLKLEYDELLSEFAFKFNLRCYSAAGAIVWALPSAAGGQGLTLVHFSAQLERFVWDRGCA
jgi:hypothetical protein